MPLIRFQIILVSIEQVHKLILICEKEN
jgi:hypothetical protein